MLFHIEIGLSSGELFQSNFYLIRFQSLLPANCLMRDPLLIISNHIQLRWVGLDRLTPRQLILFHCHWTDVYINKHLKLVVEKITSVNIKPSRVGSCFKNYFKPAGSEVNPTMISRPGRKRLEKLFQAGWVEGHFNNRVLIWYITSMEAKNQSRFVIGPAIDWIHWYNHTINSNNQWTQDRLTR